MRQLKKPDWALFKTHGNLDQPVEHQPITSTLLLPQTAPPTLGIQALTIRVTVGVALPNI